MAGLTPYALCHRPTRPVPRVDVASLGVKDEEGRGGAAATRRRDLEVGRRVADHTCRQKVHDVHGLRASVKHDGRTAHVAAHKLGRAVTVIRDPKRAGAPYRDAPGID